MWQFPTHWRCNHPADAIPPALPSACSNQGAYSGEGASACTSCPTGQYSPTTGMADQEVSSNGIHCLLCPTGSIALKADQSMNTNPAIDADDYRNELALSTGATQCDAW